MPDGNPLIIGADNISDTTTLLRQANQVTNEGGLSVTSGGKAVAVSGVSRSGVGVIGRTGIAQSSGKFVVHQPPPPCGVFGSGQSESGIYGSSASGTAVEAYSDKRFGVYGFSRAEDGVRGDGGHIGVVGHGGAPFTQASQIRLPLTTRTGSAVPPTGVLGWADPRPGPARADDVGVLGVTNGTDPSLNFGVVGYAEGGCAVAGGSVSGLAGLFEGNVRVTGATHLAGNLDVDGGLTHLSGNLTVDGGLLVLGPKSAAVKQQDGSYRLLYCVESPESWFEDFGTARLVRGRSSVRLAKDFASAVKTNQFHVFLSPEGDSAGLYVSRKSQSGFEVREQQGGRSNLRFSYRVVARRSDVSAPRMPERRIPSITKMRSNTALDKLFAKRIASKKRNRRARKISR